MEYTLNINWGQRVNICNLFPTIGTLHDMHISRVIRGVLVENESAQVLSSLGIVKNEVGMYTIPAKNENRPNDAHSITLNDESLKLFYEFVQDLSNKRCVQLEFEPFFSEVVDTYEESLLPEPGPEQEPEPEDAEEPQEP